MKEKINEKKQLRKELYMINKQRNFKRMKSERIKRERSIQKSMKTETTFKRSKALAIKKDISLAKLSIAQHEMHKT